MKFDLARAPSGALRLKMLRHALPATATGALVHEILWWNEIKRLVGKLEDGFSKTDVPELSVEHSPYCLYRKAVADSSDRCKECICLNVCSVLMQTYGNAARRGDLPLLMETVDNIIEALGDLREEARCRAREE